MTGLKSRLLTPSEPLPEIGSPTRKRLEYDPLPTLLRFHESKALFRGIRGPIGSGKSVGSCWELFRMAREQRAFNGVRKSRWGVIRSTYPELMSTTIKTWKEWFPPDICPIKYDVPITGRMNMPLPDGTMLDMEIIFVAVEREEDTGKLLSMDLTGVWFNEARELQFGIIKDAMGRIGRYPSKREGGHTRKAAIADTNPCDDDHWWYALAEEGRLSEDLQEITKDDFEFFSQPSALIKTQQGYAPNPVAENVDNLTDGYKYWLDQIPGRDQQWINVYLLGQYGTVQIGKPVYGASYNDSLHCSQVGFEPVTKWPLLLAFDFGLTPACAFMQQTPRGQIRVIEELVTERSGIRQLCRDSVKPRLTNRYKGCPVFITGDPSGVKGSDNDAESVYDVIKEELAGLYSDMAPAQSNLLSVRIDAMIQALTRLTDGRAVFQLSPEAKVLRKGFLGGYKFAKIKVAGGSERYQDSPVKNIYSHISEAVQYGVMYYLGGQMFQSLQSRQARVRPYRTADTVAGL